MLFQAVRFFPLLIVLVVLTGCSGDSDSERTSTSEKVALLFVGHGEPATFEDGNIPVTHADGSLFGPHAESLAVPDIAQHSEWAAAYEEIATAMTYIFGDINGNGTFHEVAVSPTGDVPPFFTWEAFLASIEEHYQSVGNYSPHNASIREHVENLNIRVDGAQIDTYLAFLDEVPRIPDVVWEIGQTGQYNKLVVVPMLLSDSTHTQEVESFIREVAEYTSGMEVVVSEPFFEVPFMKTRLKKAVVAMANHIRQKIPEEVDDQDIAVVLASHGTPYVPPYPEFGWEEGDIFSNLILTEDIFHHEIQQDLPWKTVTGRMNYSSPPITDSLAELEADDYKYVMVVPSAFPTAALHTMWDVADAAVGHAVVPDDGVVVDTRTSGMNVYYSAQGFADIEPGRSEFRSGLSFLAKVAVMEILEEGSDPADNEPDDGGVVPVDNTCLPGEICVTITAEETTGGELRLMLYETEGDGWPQDFRSLPTPSGVITQYPAVPDNFPIRVRIPMADNLFAISSNPLEGATLGLAIATGVSSIMVVDPTDARGFSASTLTYQTDAPMDYGLVELDLPAGDVCDLNPYHPSCLTGALFWQESFLGEQDFVPGAVYMDMADIDGDGIDDIVTVGEPHFENAELPLTALKLGVYYLNSDLTVKEMEIIDEWTEADQALYSPWGVNAIEHAGQPMIIVGTNIPGLAPLEEGNGNVYSYQKIDGEWKRSVVRDNPDPDNDNYNAMIVVTCDIDNDGDEDLALSGAFSTSSLGSWMENTGDAVSPWIPHLKPMPDGTDPFIRGTLAYKCADLNGDDYPEVIYNGMFDVPDTDPPRYRGEIWLGINPSATDSTESWEKVVIDDDNWASADMWVHDFDGDSYPDLIANQIFSSTVTRYMNPGANLADPWLQEVIISGLASPSDMWLADMDGDGLTDVVSADHTAHRGVWHKNPGYEVNDL